MKKTAIFLSCIMSAMVTGCALPPPEPKIESVTIAFQEWVGYGLFYLAEEKGFMREEGVGLVFIDEKLDSARRDAFNNRMLDCEAGTLDLLVSKAAQGTSIVAVMEIDHSFGSDAIVADGNIKTLEDLVGKRIALARDDVGETFISALFYQKGLSFDRLIIVPKLTEAVASAFLNGEAEACVTWEPQVAEALKKPDSHILVSTRERPDIIIDTLNVRRDILESKPELLKKLMRGWFKALSYYQQHPVEASETIAKYYNITPEQYRKQVEGLKWYNYEQQRALAESEVWDKSFNAIASVKLSNSRISKKPDSSKFLNHELLERLYEVSQ